MSWRNTGQFHAPREIHVQTCDQCGNDIGLPSGFGQKCPNYEIQVRTWVGCEDDPGLVTYSLCSLPCLKAMAERLSAGERVPTDKL